MSGLPYEDHGTGERSDDRTGERADDRTAARAALGLGLLALGGWLLTTARPWDKPGHPLVLGLGWTASAALLLCGLALVAHSVRAVHTAPDGSGAQERQD
ncbi:hypothetical protein AB0D54_31950 [Streptomyces xanthophaeus]|uniref:hypothetical protein n=1 Tax=Streptomyces xanthophaeus TaxID=67385 RepID=UPI0034405E5F